MTRSKLPIGIQTLRRMREGLRHLYSVLKAQDAHLRFVSGSGSVCTTPAPGGSAHRRG